MYEFEFRTGKVSIDHNKCRQCTSFACVKACSLYGRGILRVQNKKPVLSPDPEDVKKGLCIEDLSCEYECSFRGRKALKITLPIQRLEKGRSR